MGLTTRSVRLYLGSRRSLPAFEVRSRVEGDVRTRRITLPARIEVADVERATLADHRTGRFAGPNGDPGEGPE